MTTRKTRPATSYSAPAANRIEISHHIPRPGRSETEAVDDRVEPGQKYRYRVYAVFQSPRGMAGSKPSNEVEITTKKGATNDPAKTRPSLWPTVDCACV